MRHILLTAVTLLCSMLCSAATGYTIYPVPHYQDARSEKASFSSKVNVVAEQGIDEVTVRRACEVLRSAGLEPVEASAAVRGMSNILLGVNGSGGKADKEAARLHVDRSVFALDKFDRHVLKLYADKAGVAQVIILGEDTDAVFCGLASLEQIFDNGTGDLACVDILDYADIQNRGIIEGYYGVPYSAEVTVDLFRFMARYKMNTYMYGAKSDPYHSRFWSEPYPDTITEEQKQIGMLSARMLAGITEAAHAAKVNFIWAIHPGTAFMDAEDGGVNDRIMSKLESMYDLGVRQFGVFVDDVGVPSDDATLKLGADRLSDLQGRIDKRWNAPGTAAADAVKPLHYVPQLYAYSWVPRQQARRFFESLSATPDKVNIYITGRAVWTVPNNEDLAVVKDFLGRSTSWWWNYPCNDNDMTKLFTMDIYSNFRDERHIDNLARLEALSGTNTVIINPMQQGEVSKITLFSVADFCWNMEAFDNQRSWEAALPAVVGRQKAAALRALAPYLRYFDEDALLYEVTNYKNSVAEGHPRPGALAGKFNELLAACRELDALAASESESDRLLYADLRPWLLKLEAMGDEALRRISGKDAEAVDYEGNADFQFQVLNGMGEDISLSTLTAEPAAKVLRPFIDWLREQK